MHKLFNELGGTAFIAVMGGLVVAVLFQFVDAVSI